MQRDPDHDHGERRETRNCSFVETAFWLERNLSQLLEHSRAKTTTMEQKIIPDARLTACIMQEEEDDDEEEELSSN
jgi:hypothetical protein